MLDRTHLCLSVMHCGYRVVLLFGHTGRQGAIERSDVHVSQLEVVSVEPRCGNPDLGPSIICKTVNVRS